MVIRKKAQSGAKDVADYIAGAKQLKVNGVWDSFVQPHWQTMSGHRPDGSHIDPAHNGSGFLPWHREFLLRLEKEIQTVLNNSDFALPYWDWAEDSDSGTAASAFVWTDDCMGGGGRPVTTGPFRQSLWSPWQPPNGPSSGDLSRNTLANTRLPNSANVANSMTNTEYTSFRPSVESLHNSVHGWVGGDMVTAASPNDPVFFLHHCNIDRLWALWQVQNPGAQYPATGEDYGNNLKDNMWPWDQPDDLRTPEDVLDVKSLGFAYSELTVPLVFQDFSDCLNKDVDGGDSSRIGGWVDLARDLKGSVRVDVSIFKGTPNTTYEFFLKCVQSIGSVTTDGNGSGSSSLSFEERLINGKFAFDSYPSGAPAGNKFQSTTAELP